MEHSPVRRGPRKRDTGTMLVAQIQEYLGAGPSVTLAREKPWSSITFSGIRYRLEIAGFDQSSRSSRDRLNKLSEHEFSLPGQFVADLLIDLDSCREDETPDVVVDILAIADPVSEKDQRLLETI